ncbi:MAG TPA: SRPBCC family protein [Jatrophihabitantaceae bacterium]|nr:SRPBCC family protein [Jatrophihabitantaceae bacterium]
MSESVGDSIDIAASPEAVWNMVSDVTRVPEWSPELVRVRWLGGAAGPAVGARFKGTNRNGWHRWSTTCTVTEADPGRTFAYRVQTYGFSVAEWRYEITPSNGGCTLRESTIDRRGFLIKTGGSPVTGVYKRAPHNLEGIRKTLQAIKASAESR